MDIAAWLRGLGLEQYAQLSRDNDVDGEILCGMTAEDLKELGQTDASNAVAILACLFVLTAAVLVSAIVHGGSTFGIGIP